MSRIIIDADGVHELSRPEDQHDPGGRVRIRLNDSIKGDAIFSPCGRFRPLLRRWWGTDVYQPYMLWIGMNPSTADAEANDPTVHREIEFTRREGFTVYVKCNVMDYRVTDQKQLVTPGVLPCSPDNLPTILRMAEGAAKVVVCYGKLHQRLTHHGTEVIRALQAKGIHPICLGTNGDGSPKHPLYLAKITKFQPFHT